MEIHLNIVAAERMFVKLECAIEKIAEIKRLFLGGSGAREFGKILDDTRRAAGLTVRKFQLAFGGVVLSLALAKKLGDANDGGQGIVQLVGDAGEHLPHCGEFFRLDKLLLQTLEIRNIAPGENYALDVPFFVR